MDKEYSRQANNKSNKRCVKLNIEELKQKILDRFIKYDQDVNYSYGDLRNDVFELLGVKI